MDSKFLLKLFFIFISAAFGCVNAAAQSRQIDKRVKVYADHFRGDSVVVKADNDLLVPVTLTLKTKLQNLSGDDSLSVIIPPNSCGVNLCVWKPLIVKKFYTWNFNWTTTLSDSSKYKKVSGVYSLPFLSSKAVKQTQGPNGKYSHNQTEAFDFAMPEGTPIVAAREGVILLTKADSDIGGPDKSYSGDANYITIYHMDGTIANYLHFKKNGVLVKEGMHVLQGQLIGYSGNTGFSDGPHLHFELLNAFGAKSLSKFKWKNTTLEAPSYAKTNFSSNRLLSKILILFHIRSV